MPELGRLLGHGKAAQNANVGTAGLQGRALEDSCDSEWMFDENGRHARHGGRPDHLLCGQWPGAQAISLRGAGL